MESVCLVPIGPGAERRRLPYHRKKEGARDAGRKRDPPESMSVGQPLPRLPVVAEGFRGSLGRQHAFPGAAQDRPVAPDILLRHAGLGPPDPLVTERRDRETPIRVARSFLVHGRSLFQAHPGRQPNPLRNQETTARPSELQGCRPPSRWGDPLSG